MGVLWFVTPFDADGKERCDELEIDAEFPLEGNRLPTVDELRAGLRAMKDVRTEGADDPPGPRWSVWIERDDDATNLNATIEANATRHISFEKGDESLIIDILEPHAKACGVMMVSNDSDREIFFVGPGIDPYDYIEGYEEPPPEDIQALSVSPELEEDDLVVLAEALGALLDKKSVNPENIGMDVELQDGSSLRVFLYEHAPEDEAPKKLPGIVQRAVERLHESQRLGTLTDGRLKEVIARVGPLTLRLDPRS